MGIFFVCNTVIIPLCTSSFIILEKYICPNHNFELATFSFLLWITLSNPKLLFSWGPGGRSPDRVKGQNPMSGSRWAKPNWWLLPSSEGYGNTLSFVMSRRRIPILCSVQRNWLQLLLLLLSQQLFNFF